MLRRFMDASLVRMRRYSELGLWSSNNDKRASAQGLDTLPHWRRLTDIA